MGAATPKELRVPHERLQRQVEAILSAWSMPAPTARETAELIVETDLLGIDSHGISMLPAYQKLRDAGHLDLQASPTLVRESPCSALLDAGHGLGHCVAVQAMRLAGEKAASVGLGAVAVRNSHHFGAAGLYARIAAEQGLIGLVTSTTRSRMLVPSRARMPVLGTNPIAFAAPARRNRDFVLDMATTTVAANKVKVYDFYQRDVPPGWVIDAQGNPVTASDQALDLVYERPEGGLTPLGASSELGDHKGYGLAMLAQILSGPLGGAEFAALRQPGDRPDIGHFFLAIDPGAFRGAGEFEDELDDIIDELHATQPTDPRKPVLVAGDPEAQNRQQRLVEGIPLPEKLLRQLRDICDESGAAYLLTGENPIGERF